MTYSVVPHPSRISIKSDSVAFRISSFMKIVGDETTLDARDELLRFLGDVLEVFPVGGEQEIHFVLSDSAEKKGSYHIEVRKNRINLTANSAEGLFYAVQTLKQLLFQAQDNLCELEIFDEPSYDIRGFMLDCARHFFTKEEIFRFLDLMALHKLNEFHWHLSDDQGFRCQLECAPLLTEIGSVRSHTGLKNEEHSGYYTKKDIKEIISYAHSRYIKVIPEINTPGHTVSMISAYPELSCRGKEIPVATSFGQKKDVLCIGKESTFDFMLRLYDELCEMFPDGIIHIGGNGASVERWQECPHCQRRIKGEKLSDERELENYYFSRISKHLHKKGVEVRMRNYEWGDHFIFPISESDNVHIYDMNYICSTLHCCRLYLPHERINLKRAYSAIPPSFRDRKHLCGIEACLWTEHIPDIKKADFALLPRLGAFSENAWTSSENRDYDRFYENLRDYYRLLYALGYGPATLSRALPGRIRRALHKFNRTAY